MGHIIRWRELIKSASELTEVELSAKRKEDFVSKIRATRFVS